MNVKYLIREFSKSLGQIEVALQTLLGKSIDENHQFTTDKELGQKVGNLEGANVFISGGSRGIGLEIAKRFARDGANIVVAAKTTKAHPKLPGTIYTAADEIEKAGGRAIPLVVDIRDEKVVEDAVAEAVRELGGLDIIINNASAISLGTSQNTPVKKFDLMFDINVRGSFVLTKFAVPHLLKSKNPHILTLSPPINMDPKWFSAYGAYTSSKYAMSLMAKTFAEELRVHGIASNSLWPRTTIATAAVLNMDGGKLMEKRSRKPQIMADAAYEIVTRSAKTCTGNFFIDDEVLKIAGSASFEKYSCFPGSKLQQDLFL